MNVAPWERTTNEALVRLRALFMITLKDPFHISTTTYSRVRFGRYVDSRFKMHAVSFATAFERIFCNRQINLSYKLSLIVETLVDI